MTDEYTCTWCKNGQVKLVPALVVDAHWQCENCDSTWSSSLIVEYILS